MPPRYSAARALGRTAVEGHELFEKVDQIGIALLFVEPAQQDVVAARVEEHEAVLGAPKQFQKCLHVLEIDERPHEVLAYHLPALSVVLVDSAPEEKEIP